MALSISGIVSLGIATVFTFGLQQFKVLVDQNQAQSELVQASYYLRAWLTQAVKLNCGVTAGGPINMPAGNLVLPTDTNIPSGIGAGIMDCRIVPNIGPMPATNGARWNLSTATQDFNAFAVFNRDNGDAAPGATGSSSYVATGIFFAPPPDPTSQVYTTGVQKSGELYFFQDVNPVFSTKSSTSIFFDHIVDLGIVANDPNPPPNTAGNYLRSVTLRVVARYFTSTDGVQDWRAQAVNGATGATFKDIEVTIPIGFRDNVIGIDATGSNAPQRIYGSLYFFKFSGPPLASFNF